MKLNKNLGAHHPFRWLVVWVVLEHPFQSESHIIDYFTSHPVAIPCLLVLLQLTYSSFSYPLNMPTFIIMHYNNIFKYTACKYRAVYGSCPQIIHTARMGCCQHLNSTPTSVYYGFTVFLSGYFVDGDYIWAHASKGADNAWRLHAARYHIRSFSCRKAKSAILFWEYFASLINNRYIPFLECGFLPD